MDTSKLTNYELETLVWFFLLRMSLEERRILMAELPVIYWRLLGGAVT
jgi:hypothetical protein